MRKSSNNDVNAVLGRTIVNRHPPFCDTCEGPAVWSEIHGWRHKNDRWPFGIPAHEDTTGHEATAAKWSAEDDIRADESSREALDL